jgi:hypothetical protein
MSASELPSDVGRARNRFQAWRARRVRGSRIPRALRGLAVRLAKRHGISRTVGALGVDYYSLKKQVEASAGALPSARDSAFVELPSPLMVGKQCLFELDNSTGARMRMQLMGYDANEIERLARSLWNAE